MILNASKCLLFQTPISYEYHICYLSSADNLIHNKETILVYHWRRLSAEHLKVGTVRETSRDSKNPEKTNRIWKTSSRLPDFYLTVITMGTIMNKPIQWFAHNSSIIHFIYDWFLFNWAQWIKRLKTHSLPLPLPLSPTLSCLPSLPPSLSHHWSVQLNE